MAKEIFTIGNHAFAFFHNLSITIVSIDWGLVLLAAFILLELRVERKGNTPLVSMKLFQNSQFTSGTLTTMIIFLGQAGMFFTLPVFFQAVRNLDAFHTGLSLLSLSLSVLVAAPLSGVIGKKFTSKRIAQTGILINTIAFLVLRMESFSCCDGKYHNAWLNNVRYWYGTTHGSTLQHYAFCRAA